MKDEEFYLEATKELDENRVIPALWAKSLALTEGDAIKARFTYIKLRVKQFADESELNKPSESNINKSKANNTGESGFFLFRFYRKLVSGSYGLTKTFWVFGVLAGVIIGPIFILISQAFRAYSLSDENITYGLHATFLIYVIAYASPVLLGIWRASSKHKGLLLWKIAAKAYVVFAFFYISIVTAGLFFNYNQLFYRITHKINAPEYLVLSNSMRAKISKFYATQVSKELKFNTEIDGLKIIRLLATDGDAEAQYLMGIMYDKNPIAPDNHSEACKWYIKSAKQDYSKAFYHAGLCLDDYYDQNENHPLAIEWYIKSAESGDANGQYALAKKYLMGHGVEQNAKEFNKLQFAARSQGHEEAIFDYSLVLFGDKKYENALKFSEQYHEKNPKNSENIGLIIAIHLLEGNQNQARTWFKKYLPLINSQEKIEDEIQLYCYLQKFEDKEDWIMAEIEWFKEEFNKYSLSKN